MRTEIEKILREEMISLNELAERSGVSWPALKRMIDGTTDKPREQNLRKIGDAVGRFPRYTDDGGIEFVPKLPDEINRKRAEEAYSILLGMPPKKAEEILKKIKELAKES